MRDLVFYHDDNSTFIDHTNDSRDYLRDDFQINFTNTEDKLYIGLYKPFNQSYFELKTPSGTDVNLTAEYWDGTTYQTLKLMDDSKGFTRSGFITFDKPSDWASNEINSDTKYYIRLNADSFIIDIQGANTVFSDDNDLRQDVRCIDEYTQGSDTSFIAYHVNARNEIIQTLRNGGNSTRLSDTISAENLTKWDILEVGEIRQAAKYLALSKIFYDTSENIDDKQYQRAIDYNQKFGEAFKLYRMSIDKNDDGISDDEEKTQLRGMRIHKR